jgi:phage terminase small subunit
MKPSKVPVGLQKRGRWFWNHATDERDFTDAHDIERLSMACKTLDEISADEATLKAEGRFTADRWGRAIPHPAVKTLGENRILFLRIVRELGLDLVTAEDPRPPRQY